MTEKTKKLFIKTYGCQMNFYDSGRMLDLMKIDGFDVVDDVDESDLIILNTCHIREKAAEKMYSDIGRIKKSSQKKGRKPLVAVAGCVAQAEGKEIMRRAPFVDIVVGPQSYQRLPELVDNAQKAAVNKDSVVELDFSSENKFDALPEQSSDQAVTAFLTIQEGCDKFCTYCVVPYTRGAEFSRPFNKVMAEARALIAGGACEITLLGQNVNAYHGEADSGNVSLASLIKALADIEDLQRIRYITSHPKDMRDDLIAAHGEVEKLMPFLHLPVQAGSDRILKAMNRSHSADEYRRIIENLRKVRPDIAVSSDFIVGFPTETEAEFEETMQIIRDVNFSQCYSFTYSPRPGTPAATREDDISRQVKKERLARLQDLVNQQQVAFNKKMIGQIKAVLFDRKGNIANQFIGRSPYMQSVHVVSKSDIIGQMHNVKITNSMANSLSGELMS